MHTARPLAAGRTEIQLSGGPWYAKAGVPEGSTGQAVEGWTGNAEIGVRHGVAGIFDFGIRGFPIGAAVDVNFGVYDSPLFALSVDPMFTFVYHSDKDDSVFVGQVFANILADIWVGKILAVTLGLKPGFAFVSASGEEGGYSAVLKADGFTIGGSLGLKVHIGGVFALMPEVDVLHYPKVDVTTMQIQLGLMFGF